MNRGELGGRLGSVRSVNLVRAAEPAMLGQVVLYAVMGMLIFFAMSGYLPVSGTRTSSLQAMSSTADTVYGQLFQGAAWMLGLLLMAPHASRILRTCLEMKTMLLIPVLAIGSAAWSQDPATSVRKGVFLLLGTLFAFYLARRFRPEELAEILLVTGVCAGVMGIAVSLLLPEFGRDTFNGGAWQGIFRSKNGCAQIMLFLLSPAMVFRLEDRRMQMLRVLLFPLAGVLVVMSMAKTAWLLAPVLLALVAGLLALRRMERRSVLFVVIAGAVLLLAAGALLPTVTPYVLEALGKDPGMSGRSSLWAGAVLSILKRPLLGYGYAAFWTGMKGESLNIYMATHFEIYQAQNGILEVWLELGLLGVVLVLLTLGRAVRDAVVCLQLRHTRSTVWYMSLLALTVAYNVDETFLASAHSMPWLLYTVACAGLAREAREARAGRVRVGAGNSAGARPFEQRLVHGMASSG